MCTRRTTYFLIDVFEALKKSCPQAVLLLAGTGERFETVKKIIREKGLEDSVRLLGFRPDVERLMQGMDFFVLPSYFEGLPYCGGRGAGLRLPCLMSDTITGEARITQNCWYLSLKESPGRWSDFILEHKTGSREKIQWVGNREQYSMEALKQQQKKLLE